MARIRTIKPEFWTDPAIIECSMNARLLFIGLLNFADDEGNIEASAKMIKALIFPSDDLDVYPSLAELEDNHLLICYEVDGRQYYNIKGFKRHQKIDRPGKPRCPIYDESTNDRPTIDDHSSPEGKGREGKGRELKPIKQEEKNKNPNLLSKNKKELMFDARWLAYEGEKDNRKMALKHWNAKIRTQKDVDNYDKAVLNYYAIVAHSRGNGFLDRRLKGGKTWFNNFESYIDQEPPQEKTADGIERERQRTEPKQKEFCEVQLIFVEAELQAGEIRDYKWFYLSLEKLVVEYEQRFGYSPFGRVEEDLYTKIRDEMKAKEER